MDHTVKEIKLSNGSKGLIINVPDAKVMTLQLEFRAGEYLVSDDKWETPHIMEHMLLGANKQFPNSKIFEEEIERNGAYNNASTSAYDIIYKVECADFEWDRVLNLLLIAISEPIFLKDEFTAEFENITEELVERSDDQFRHLNLSLRKEFGLKFKTDQERLKLMKNVSIVDVKNHYRKTHNSKNMRFIIGGNFLVPNRYETFIESLKHVKLPAGDVRFDLPEEKPTALNNPLLIKDNAAKSLYFHIDTFMNKRLTINQEEALNLANIILTDTYYSKILGAAREHGLVYDLASGTDRTKTCNNWWIEAQVPKKNISLLFDIIVYELQNILNGKISNEDIDKAKEYAIGHYQRSYQTVGEVIDGYSDRYYFDEVIDDYYQIPKRIEAISDQAIVESVRLLFADKIWGLGILGNCDENYASELHKRISVLWDRKSI